MTQSALTSLAGKFTLLREMLDGYMQDAEQFAVNAGHAASFFA